MRSIFLVLVLCLQYGVSYAEDSVVKESDSGCENLQKSPSDRSDQGWYFYETDPPCKHVKPPPQTDKKVDTDPEPEKKPMTVAWMKKMIPIMQERAYDNPTRENVAAYAYLVRAMGDKAQRYTDVHMDLIKSDPFLDMNNSMPFNGANRNQVIAEAESTKREALKLVAKKAAGIFVFFDSKCAYCRTQIASVNRVSKEFNFNVMYISVDGKGLPGATGWVKDNGTAKMLGINYYPTTILAIPPKTYLPISFGLMADDQLQSRLLETAKYAKLIPADMVKNFNPNDRGVLTLEDMKDGAYDDPDKFVKYMQEKLKDRY